MDELFPGREIRRVPITEHQIISSTEIEAGIRDRLAKYKGEDLVRELLDLVMLNLIEVIMTKDPDPTRLERLSQDKLETIKRLAAGILPSPPSK